MLYFSTVPERRTVKSLLHDNMLLFHDAPVFSQVRCHGDDCTELEGIGAVGAFGSGSSESEEIQALSNILWAEGALSCSAEGIRELADFAKSAAASQEGFLLLDDAGRIVLCNSAFSAHFNLRPSVLGLSFGEVFCKGGTLPGARHSEAFYRYVTNEEQPFYTDVVITDCTPEDGGEKNAWLASKLPYRLDGKPAALYLLHRPAGFHLCPEHGREETGPSLYEQNQELLRLNAQLRIENAERSAVTQALRRAESRYRDIFDNATEGILQWTPDKQLISANMSFARMMGFSTVNALFFNVAEGGFCFCASAAAERELIDVLEQRGSISNFEFQMERSDGMQLWASMNARRVTGPGGYTSYYEAFIENISNRKLAEEKLVYQAFHDPLTGLANRVLFYDRVKMALRRAARQRNYSFAVLYLDLDRFKIVNDTFGHNTGDDVLSYAAMEITACVRAVDTTARFGGDEFAILIEEVERGASVVQVAKRIHAALSRPFAIKGREINISASIGIVLKAENYDLPENILRDADTAMYRAKADRTHRYKVFSQKMREETLENIIFETDLRQGIQDREFVLVYQPVISMLTGELYGFEALLRWKHAGQDITPARFIPVAEETGLIKMLGMQVIENACLQAVEWKKVCPRPLLMHLNISGRQLLFPSFPREVQSILEYTGVDPSLLLFEITESVLLDNRNACIQVMRQIQDLGVNFCLDDFGTGFSSLSYLRQLPLSCIKVDRSFVTELETDAPSLTIVRNLVSLGKDLGLSVIVEGIERQTQAETLLSVGCTLAQGYFFHRPLEEKAAAALLRHSCDWGTAREGLK